VSFAAAYWIVGLNVVVVVMSKSNVGGLSTSTSAATVHAPLPPIVIVIVAMTQ